LHHNSKPGWLTARLFYEILVFLLYKSILKRNFTLYFLIFCLSVLTACKKESVQGVYDDRTLGTSAHDLLTAAPYSSLQIEIQYMPGYAPDQAALANLVAFLKTRINKPGDISVTQEQIPAGSSSVATLSDIVNTEQRYRNLYSHNNLLRVYILITNGAYSKSDVLATSYWNTSFCLFGKAIDNNSSPANRSILLATLLEHEFGHLMGLVDQGTPMLTDHRDAANGAHCDNADCLMYFDVEAGASGSLSAVPLMDANCIADLRANGGK
jgi:hypothetical protein